MTHTALSATGVLRRAAECVLMAFGVPVTRDMPVDAVFLPVAAAQGQAAGCTREVDLLNVNPANGAAMLGERDEFGYLWGCAGPEESRPLD